jgi:hypothetical protein
MSSPAPPLPTPSTPTPPPPPLPSSLPPQFCTKPNPSSDDHAANQHIAPPLHYVLTPIPRDLRARIFGETEVFARKPCMCHMIANTPSTCFHVGHTAGQGLQLPATNVPNSRPLTATLPTLISSTAHPTGYLHQPYASCPIPHLSPEAHPPFVLPPAPHPQTGLRLLFGNKNAIGTSLSIFVRSATTNLSSIVEQGNGEVLSTHQHVMKASYMKPELMDPYWFIRMVKTANEAQSCTSSTPPPPHFVRQI